MFRQPVCQLIDRWNIISAGVVIPFGPTLDLALHVALRRSQITQTRGFVIDLVYLSEVLNKRLRKTTHYFSREFHILRWLCTQYDSLHALHHIERGAEYLLIVAKQE